MPSEYVMPGPSIGSTMAQMLLNGPKRHWRGGALLANHRGITLTRMLRPQKNLVRRIHWLLTL